MNELYDQFQMFSQIEDPLHSAKYLEFKANKPELAKRLNSLLSHNNTEIEVLHEKIYAPLLPLDNPELRLGRIIDGKYKIVELIGQGGMSDVYKAIRCDDLIKHTVAVKYFSLADNFLTALEMIKNEAQILALLDHHYIASFIDIGHDDNDEPNVMMEYIEGQTLFSYLKKSPETTSLTQVYATLEEAKVYVENKGIIHGDISLNNVLVDNNGNANIIDFDIAQYRNLL